MSELRSDPDHEALLSCRGRHHAVVAPPGTGKTCAAVRLAGSLASSLAEHERVLLLTFSNQARVQLETEAREQFDRATAARVEITNYHRFFWQAVRSYCRALGLPLDVQITSRRRRLKSLEATGVPEVKALKKREGLLECLAEQRFPEFRGAGSLSESTLATLLDAIDAEQAAGYLVFDDLGALFWQLLDTYPNLRTAYRARYPVVLADEHQDASALQDAVVRELGTRALVVFADPMQMIYGFRGADPRRLSDHVDECDCRHEFSTPHRWHGNEEVAAWLLAVRSRLMGQAAASPRPADVHIASTKADYGRNAALRQVRIEVSRLFASGASSVAVLTRRNDDVAAIRNHLSKNGMFPRQVGSGEDFEEARFDIEQLPLLTDGRSLANHALGRLTKLVPTLEKSFVDQVQRRLGESGADIKGSSARVRSVLQALMPLYDEGGGAYFRCLAAALDACSAQGHHLPRRDAVRSIRETAIALGSSDVDEALRIYGRRAVAAAESAREMRSGLFVMTAHQSKGKEFDAVVVAGISRDQFPDDEDSRRLLYVALTRARSAWVFITPDRGESPLLSAF
jgi:DNA helicase-2/ATP-dependent DNA helicase PcrA